MIPIQRENLFDCVFHNEKFKMENFSLAYFFNFTLENLPIKLKHFEKNPSAVQKRTTSLVIQIK